jgi:crotonobetainyl-CoA:carnitine CoA-transferase CaiB-like acyl-CoA transferase
MSHAFPYRGLRVLDLGQGVASPYCAMLLALYGAEVIKVEPPEGDWSRGLGQKLAGGAHTPMSLTFNRGKRALRLDLKRPEARKILRDLALKADVLVEGFRPGVAARLGVGYESLSAENPRLIYLSVSGFGQQGPYSQRPVTDTAAQAFSGFMDTNRGPDGIPHRSGALTADVPTGLYAYAAVATALFAREQTGQGRHIDVSLMAGSAALMGHKVPEFQVGNVNPPQLNVPAGSFEASDGWLAIALVREDDWRRTCLALERPDWLENPAYGSFALRVEHLRAQDVISDTVNTSGDWLANEHVKAVGASAAVGIDHFHVARTPGAPAESDAALTPPPAAGQHSRAVLAECGLDAAEIDRLFAEGIAS